MGSTSIVWLAVDFPWSEIRNLWLVLRSEISIKLNRGFLTQPRTRVKHYFISFIKQQKDGKTLQAMDYIESTIIIIDYVLLLWSVASVVAMYLCLYFCCMPLEL